MTDILPRGVIPLDLLPRLASGPPDGPAVYFLFHGDEVVYIGASLAPAARVHEHGLSRRKQFTRVAYLPVTENEMGAIEAEMIRRIRPKRNGKHNPEPDDSERPWGLVTSGYTLRVPAEYYAAVTARHKQTGQNRTTILAMALESYFRKIGHPCPSNYPES